MKKTERLAAELLKKAKTDGRNRDYESAVKKLKKLLFLTDSLPEALLYLGRASHELCRYDEAVIAFRMFITKMPKLSAGYFYLGRTYIAAGNFNRAASCFSESLKLKPDFSPALAYYGYSLMRRGLSEKAVEYLRRAVEADPENKQIYTMYINSIFVLGLKLFRKEEYIDSLNCFLFLESAGYNSVSTKLYTGIIYKELKDYKNAAFYIKDASDDSPDDDLIKNILSELYIKLSMVDDAMKLLSTYKSREEIEQFLESIDDSERSFAVSFWNKNDYRAALHFAVSSLKKKRTPDMHLLAGECLKNIGSYNEAFNHYSRAQEMDRNALEPLYGKCVILWLKNDYKSMLALLDKILSRNNSDDFASYYRILCFSKLKKDFYNWKEDLDALLNNGADPWLLNAKGWGQIEKNDKKHPQGSFKKAIKQMSDLREAWSGLILCYKSENDGSELISALKKYLNIFNDDLDSRKDYADLLIEEKLYSNAAAEFKIIISKARPDLTLLKKLAYCYRESGSYKDAVVIYRQILSNDPFNENYLKMLLYCMRKDGRDAETLPLLKRAVEEFKNPSLDLLLVYGVSLYRNNFNEQALNVFQKCIYNGSNDWRVYKNLGIIYREKGLDEWSEMYLRKAEQLKKN